MNIVNIVSQDSTHNQGRARPLKDDTKIYNIEKIQQIINNFKKKNLKNQKQRSNINPVSLQKKVFL